ncbi:MAG: hypothetical protein KDC98_25690 [Planctomycetes bacterium]|nr:hypothetical protein [Planctomycetota bacterium]
MLLTAIITLTMPQQPAATAEFVVPVIRADEGREVQPMRAFSQGITADGHGQLWALVHDSGPGDEPERQLLMLCSTDGGATWQRRSRTPMPWSTFGALCGAPGSDVLHVAWTTRLAGSEFSSAVYQRFDAEQGAWLGEPEVLQTGKGAENQFGIGDFARAADGTLLVLVTTHRRPGAPWPSGWSTGLMLRQPGADSFAEPLVVNTSTFGVWANLQVRGGRAHASFRSSPMHSIIAYRSLDLTAGRWLEDEAPEISVGPDTGRTVANASSLLVGPDDHRTVVYPAARQQAGALRGPGGADNGANGNGCLLIAFADGSGSWRTTTLIEDPGLESGNIGHENFVLTPGPGHQVIALYSRFDEQHRVLYRRVIERGEPIGREEVVQRAELDGAFARLSAVRDARLLTRVQALVGGIGPGAELGVRAVLGRGRLPTRWQ